MTAPAASPEREVGPYRYGVFLRPSPELIEEALRGYAIVTDQYGFTAARAYPPHVTLVGSIALDPARSEADFLDAIDAVASGRRPFPLVNHGIEIVRDAIGYQVADPDDRVVPGIVDLMGAVLEAIRPLRVFPPTDRTTSERLTDSTATFAPHLSLLGHDGAERPELVRECFEVLRATGIGGPSLWTGEWVTVYRFRSDDWTDRYWETMSWEVARSWRLSAG